MIKDDEMQEQIDFLRAEIQNLRDRLTNNVGLPSPGTAGQGLFTDAARPYWGNVTVGTVTSVGGTAPVTSSGGSTPTISMLSATGARDGYLTSANWTTFNNKQAAFAGSTAQYVRGDGSLATSVFGTVTSVGATAPVASSGGATPTISMAAATSSVNGYLTSANWTTFNNKQAAFAGTTAQYVRGDGSLATSVFGTVTSVGATAPVVSSGGATPTISMAAATSSVNGYLTSTNWTTFNGKQAGATDLTTLSGFGAGTGYAKRTGSGTWSLNSTIATTDINWTGTTGQYIRGDGSLATFSAGGGVWGSITGTLSSQTDLVAALALKGTLAATNSWSADNTFSTTMVIGPNEFVPTFAKVFTPSTSNWYRVGTFPVSNQGQYVDLILFINSPAHHLVKLRIGKGTYNSLGTTFHFETLGCYDSTYGFAQFRVVDGGTNTASYLDCKFNSAGSSLSIHGCCQSTCPVNGATDGFNFDTSLTSQGSGASGTPFSGLMYEVHGDTLYGVHEYTDFGGVKTVQKAAAFQSTVTFSVALSLPGTTGQYVRGDGSFASLYTGSTSQYVRGDGSLQTFPTIPAGTVTSVSAGNGMSFTTFTTSGSIVLGTPSTLTASTTNSSSAGTHTHAITGFLPVTGGTLSGTLTGTTIQGSTIKETSDKKFKNDIRAMHDGLYIIQRLKPVRFYNLLTEGQEIGFIAQDVRGVLPEVVSTDDNGDLAVSYQRLVAPIIEAIQSIDRRLVELERRA